jgi:osmotically-inducible protein OsmY
MTIRKTFRQVLGIGFALMLLFSACKPSDAAIAESVKSKISAVASGLSVDVKEGVVTLSGEVKDDATKAAVESALAGIKGVKSVVNSLTVPPPPPPPVVINPDDLLKKAIDSTFTAKGISGITAAISNGEVTLTGEVKKADLQKVMQAAMESKPRKVNNQMKIVK